MMRARISLPLPLRYRPLSLLAIVGALCTVLCIPQHVHAAYGVCRTDPKLTLSNGAVVSLSVSLAAEDLPAVGQIEYVVHGPADSSVTSTAFDGYGYLESVSYHADQRPGRYEVMVRVDAHGHIPVAAGATLIGSSCANAAINQAGFSNVPLRFDLSC